MKRTTIYLDPELEVLLKLEMLRQRRPMAKIVREAVQAYVAREPRVARQCRVEDVRHLPPALGRHAVAYPRNSFNSGRPRRLNQPLGPSPAGGIHWSDGAHFTPCAPNPASRR